VPTSTDAAAVRPNLSASVRRAELGALLAYVTESKYPLLYRAIMDVFLTAAAAYDSQLRPHEVHARLVTAGWSYPVTVKDVEARLGSLFEWGNLTRYLDDDATTTLESYERNEFVYDLTPAGEVVHEAIVGLDEDLRKVGGLQTVLLRQILDVLETLVALLAAPAFDGEALYTRIEELRTVFKAMTGNAALFMQQVNRMLAVPRLEARQFVEFKRDTFGYLAGFIADLDEIAPEIRASTEKIAKVSPSLCRTALRAAFRASGQRSVDGRNAEYEWIDAAERQLAAVVAWFADEPGAATGVTVLAERTRQAVLGILRAAERIAEAGNLPSARTGDLLALARMFENADDDEIHAIWKAAFGLTAAVHLHDRHPEVETAAGLPVAEAPRIEMSVRLRTTETGETVRNVSKLPNHAATRELLAAATRAELSAVAEASARLTALGPRRLSDLDTVLDRSALKLLARLVFRAERNKPSRDGSRQAVSVDGRLRVRIRDPHPFAAAVVRADGGRWTLPDYEVEITATRPGGA